MPYYKDIVHRIKKRNAINDILNPQVKLSREVRNERVTTKLTDMEQKNVGVAKGMKCFCRVVRRVRLAVAVRISRARFPRRATRPTPTPSIAPRPKRIASIAEI